MFSKCETIPLNGNTFKDLCDSFNILHSWRRGTPSPLPLGSWSPTDRRRWERKSHWWPGPVCRHLKMTTTWEEEKVRSVPWMKILSCYCGETPAVMWLHGLIWSSRRSYAETFVCAFWSKSVENAVCTLWKNRWGYNNLCVHEKHFFKMCISHIDVANFPRSSSIVSSRQMVTGWPHITLHVYLILSCFLCSVWWILHTFHLQHWKINYWQYCSLTST